MSEILPLTDVATEYRISADTLRYWRQRGEGPKSFKRGRRVVYRRADVEEWIDRLYDAENPGQTA